MRTRCGSLARAQRPGLPVDFNGIWRVVGLEYSGKDYYPCRDSLKLHFGAERGDRSEWEAALSYASH